MIKVMLVDDSDLTLTVLKKILAPATDIEVVGTAKNGQEALVYLPKLQPDVICSDLNMPVMDGLEFTKAVMEKFPRPILIISAVVQNLDSENIFKLIQAGAIDVIAKPHCKFPYDSELNSHELISKIRVLAGVHVIPRKTAVQTTDESLPILPEHIQTNLSLHIIGIGASTGGPQALQEILAELPADFSLPILCVQHISEGFTVGLVNWLNQTCKVHVKMAETGEIPKAGTVYFAPDNKQLEINAQKQLICASTPTHDGHRPSISVTLQSLALRFGNHAAGVLLTGMGQDGVEGLQLIKQVGGITLAQDEASSVVFGMPKEAIAQQAAQLVLPLNQIAAVLLRLAKTS